MTEIKITTVKAPYPRNLADEHFHLRAKLADLKVELAAVEAAILSTKRPFLEGNFASVRVSSTKDGFSIDYKRAAEEMLAPNVLSKFRKFRKGGWRFTSTARQGDEDVA